MGDDRVAVGERMRNQVVVCYLQEGANRCWLVALADRLGTD